MCPSFTAHDELETSLDSYVDDVNVFVWFLSFGVDFGVGDPLDHLHAFGTPSEHSVLVV